MRCEGRSTVGYGNFTYPVDIDQSVLSRTSEAGQQKKQHTHRETSKAEWLEVHRAVIALVP